MHDLIITEPARKDIQEAFDWWRDHRSAVQAERWYSGTYEAIGTLRRDPERCAKSPETDLLRQGVRQLLIGIGQRPTHRIVFTVSKNVVTILRVRHSSQGELRPDDVM
jgi:plasmid stabilization system protein ParE